MQTVLQLLINAIARVAHYFGVQLNAPAPYFRPNTVETVRVRGVWQ